MALCSQIHTKHINTLCGQNVEFVNVKLVVHIVTIDLNYIYIQTVPRSKHSLGYKNQSVNVV